MSKYYGLIGFAIQEKTVPGVCRERIEEHPYRGELLENSRKWEAGEGVNDDLNIANKISIIADDFAARNFYLIRYVTYRGVRWKVRSVDVSYPRLYLSIGGVYNEQQTGITN